MTNKEKDKKIDEITLKEFLNSKIESQKEAVAIALDAQKEAVKIALAAQKESVFLAQASLEKRLEGMNEFRNQLKDQAVQFINRKEQELLIIKVDIAIEELKKRIAETMPRKEHEAVHSILEQEVKVLSEKSEVQRVQYENIYRENGLSQNSLEKRLESMNEFRNQLKDQAASFITRDMHELLISKYDSEIKQLNSYKDVSEGKANQSSVIIAYILAVIGILISLSGIIFKVGK